jgi:hypothetical protein
MQGVGACPMKVLVNADELLAWCLLRKQQNNAGARAQFVSERCRTEGEGGT